MKFKPKKTPDSESGYCPTTKENLTELEQILDLKTFFRLNRSEIVNLNFIERLEPDFHDPLVVKLRNSNVKLTSSTNRTANLRKWLEAS